MQIPPILLILKEKSVCFSGYRLQKFLPDTNFEEIKLAIRNTIVDLAQKGYTTFLNGMAEGFDMLAAEEVVKFKTDNSNIRFIACMPCYNFREFNPHDQKILSHADDIVTISDKVGTKAYHTRNRFMVDNSSVLVCYFDGKTGGTKYTVDYAKKQGIEVINLAESL